MLAPSSFKASLSCPPDSPVCRMATASDSGTAQPQCFLDIAQQIRLLVRLAEIALDTDFQGALAMLLASTRSDHDDRHVLETRIVLHVGSEFVTVHARHF